MIIFYMEIDTILWIFYFFNFCLAFSKIISFCIDLLMGNHIFFGSPQIANLQILGSITHLQSYKLVMINPQIANLQISLVSQSPSPQIFKDPALHWFAFNIFFYLCRYILDHKMPCNSANPQNATFAEGPHICGLAFCGTYLRTAHLWLMQIYSKTLPWGFPVRIFGGVASRPHCLQNPTLDKVSHKHHSGRCKWDLHCPMWSFWADFPCKNWLLMYLLFIWCGK